MARLRRQPESDDRWAELDGPYPREAGALYHRAKQVLPDKVFREEWYPRYEADVPLPELRRELDEFERAEC